MLGTQVRRSLWENGFEIVKWEYLEFEKTMWVEAAKPGSFNSIRKSEAMGKIEELPKVKRLRELREEFIGLSEQQLLDILKRENID